jgi:hypothetical protein
VIGRWVRGGAFAAVAIGMVTACSFLVDGEWKDLSDTCQLPHAGDNACGTCITTSCQAQINANCLDNGNSLATSLSGCMQNPGFALDTTSCSDFLDDASVNQTGQSPSQFALRSCVAAKCEEKCTDCYDIDAGSETCGLCIMQSCGAMLNGRSGCCGNSEVRSGIAECTDPVTPQCPTFFRDGKDAGYTDADPFCEGDQNFAVCVFQSCISLGKCPHP